MVQVYTMLPKHLKRTPNIMMMILPIIMMRMGVVGGRTSLFLVFYVVMGFYDPGITHSGPCLGSDKLENHLCF